MIHTVVCFYDDDSCDTYVGLVVTEKSLTDEEKRAIADRFGAGIDGQPGSHSEDGCTISFIERTPVAAIPGEIELTNIFPIGPVDDDDSDGE